MKTIEFYWNISVVCYNCFSTQFCLRFRRSMRQVRNRKYIFNLLNSESSIFLMIINYVMNTCHCHHCFNVFAWVLLMNTSVLCNLPLLYVLYLLYLLAIFPCYMCYISYISLQVAIFPCQCTTSKNVLYLLHSQLSIL